MESILILDCCGYEVKTGTKTYEYVDCYKLKKGSKFFKKNLSDGREVNREIMLSAICPNCHHRIIRFLFYAKNSIRFQDWDETKIVRGKDADEIFERRYELYDMIDLPNPFKPKVAKGYAKHPGVYYKMLPNQQAQVPRYMDESGDAGLKLYVPLKVYK